MQSTNDEKALDFTLIASPQRLNGYHESIAEIYTANGWGSEYSQDMIEKMFSSGYYLVAISKQKAVGFLRAFTDGVCVTHLSEIAVHPHQQKKGIASLLLNRFMQDLAHTTIYAETMNALSESLMTKHGFTHRPQFKVYTKNKITSSK